MPAWTQSHCSPHLEAMEGPAPPRDSGGRELGLLLAPWGLRGPEVEEEDLGLSTHPEEVDGAVQKTRILLEVSSELQGTPG